MRRRFVLFLWSFLFLLVLAMTLVVVAVQRGWIGNMPDMAELENPINKFASQAITSDGRLIGTWSRSENRVFVPRDSIASHLYEALIATEDERFYEHSGIDAKALGRAIVKRGLLGQKQAGGGSTITQQLAKQLYSEQASSTLQRLFQKPIEWIIAVELERYYTKEEIMTLYLNYFDFLHNAVGIKTAANVYFGKSPRQLTLLEAATLIGMCKNPSYFNPVRNAERCRERRNVVLGQMVKTGRLSQVEYRELIEKPVELNFHRVDHKEGQAPYMREYLRRTLMADEPRKKDYREWQMQQYYADSIAWATDPLYGWCKKNRKRDGSHYDIYTDGLKVYTSIDSRMQQYAEEAVFNHVARGLQPEFNRKRWIEPNFPYSSRLSKEEIRRIIRRSVRQSERYRAMKAAGASEQEIDEAFATLTPMTMYTHHGEIDTTMTPLDSIRHYKSFLRAGLLSMDPSTGHVKAYVGGLNYAHFQYDMAMTGRRQIGSTMKPFVFSLAMEDGYTAEEHVSNAQRTYMVAGRPWTPRNANRSRAGQMVTLRWGLSQSSNWATANLMNAIDPTGRRLMQLLHTFGVHNPDIHPSMALCLGPCDITVGEMASAYTAFANRGIRCAPILVTRIEDSEGNVVAQFSPRMNEVISEQSSFEMIKMLQAVVDQGTGKRLRYKYNLEGEMAGKTGTTNNNSDGWYVGFVPRLVTACWVGGEDRDIHFTSTSLGQGASTALPIWALFMNKVYRNAALGYRQDEKFFLGKTATPARAKPKAEQSASEIPEEAPSSESNIFD